MDFESSYTPYLSEEKLKYLRLLAEKYPSIPAVCREIINLKAILNLPKGTEHFMSDLHGEYEAFYHILNICISSMRFIWCVIFCNVALNICKDFFAVN